MRCDPTPATHNVVHVSDTNHRQEHAVSRSFAREPQRMSLAGAAMLPASQWPSLPEGTPVPDRWRT
jgi:hypothetical protein